MEAAEVGYGGGGSGGAEFWQPTDIKERVSAQNLAKTKPPHPPAYIPNIFHIFLISNFVFYI